MEIASFGAAAGPAAATSAAASAVCIYYVVIGASRPRIERHTAEVAAGQAAAPKLAISRACYIDTP